MCDVLGVIGAFIDFVFCFYLEVIFGYIGQVYWDRVCGLNSSDNGGVCCSLVIFVCYYIGGVREVFEF